MKKYFNFFYYRPFIACTKNLYSTFGKSGAKDLISNYLKFYLNSHNIFAPLFPKVEYKFLVKLRNGSE